MEARLAKEIKMLEFNPPPGVSAWPVEDSLIHLHADVQGPTDSPYEGGVFRLDVQIPSRYPNEPPQIRFHTPIYHPNIDSGGRICLDALKMPPTGAWRPALNLSTVLSNIQLLLAEPNPDDGLMADITAQFKNDRAAFQREAAASTRRHASTEARAAAVALHAAASSSSGSVWRDNPLAAAPSSSSSTSGASASADTNIATPIDSTLSSSSSVAVVAVAQSSVAVTDASSAVSATDAPGAPDVHAKKRTATAVGLRPMTLPKKAPKVAM